MFVSFGAKDPTTMSGDSLKRFTLEEVAKHKDPKGESKEVWIVLHDLVYDVTKFLDEVKSAFQKLTGPIISTSHSNDINELKEN